MQRCKYEWINAWRKADPDEPAQPHSRNAQLSRCRRHSTAPWGTGEVLESPVAIISARASELLEHAQEQQASGNKRSDLAK